MVTTMHKSATFLILVCALGLVGCTSEVEKCVEAGLKQDLMYKLSISDKSDKGEIVREQQEYKYRLICLHGPTNEERPR